MALTDDTFFVSWTGQPDPPFVAFRTWWPMPLYGQSFDTAGRALDEPRQLTSWWDGWYSERVASDGRGHLAFVWDDPRRYLVTQRFSVPGPGRLTWTTPRLVVAEGSGEAVLAVARTDGGDAVIAWSRLAEIEAVWLPGSTEGADAAEVLTLSTGPPDLNGGPNAIALPDGRFLVAWHRVVYRGSQIVGRILTPAAVGPPTVGPEIVLSTTDANRGHVEAPSLAAAGERLLAAWSVVDANRHRRWIYVQLFDGHARPLGGELRIPTLNQGAPQSQAAVAANATGAAAVSWMEWAGQNPGEIGLRRLTVPPELPDRERPERPPRRP